MLAFLIVDHQHDHKQASAHDNSFVQSFPLARAFSVLHAIHGFSILANSLTLSRSSTLGYRDYHSAKPNARHTMKSTHQACARELREYVDKAILDDIALGKYTRVLMGPERALTNTFMDTVKVPTVKTRLALISIDECHLVSQWQRFRPLFSKVSLLLSHLSAIVSTGLFVLLPRCYVCESSWRSVFVAKNDSSS